MSAVSARLGLKGLEVGSNPETTKLSIMAPKGRLMIWKIVRTQVKLGMLARRYIGGKVRATVINPKRMDLVGVFISFCIVQAKIHNQNLRPERQHHRPPQ